MDNLYIVESPLQALCALEIALETPQQTHGIVVKISYGNRLRNDQQILSIVDQHKWDYRYLLKDLAPSRFFWGTLHHDWHLRKALIHIKRQFSGKVTRLYLGEFRSLFMHRLKCALGPEEVILLDDGTAVLKLVKQYFSKGWFYPKNRTFFTNTLKKRVPDAFHFRTLNLKKLNQKIRLATVYSQVDYDWVTPLTFTNVKKHFHRPQPIDPSLVYYYGSRYSELNILSLAYELSFLKKIAHFYGAKNQRVIYFAHRYESPEKLAIIKKELDFDISIPEQTAEVFLLESDRLPAEIAGAFSSILINASVLFPLMQVRSFRLDSHEVSAPFREEIEMIYAYFSRSGIDVIPL